jgi:hypothetical protein
MTEFYVYHIIHPITGNVFYVGKGKGQRCCQHFKDTLETSHNKRLWGHINNIRKQGLEPLVIKIQENLTEMYAYDLEELEIKKYGRIGMDDGGILMNIVDGGGNRPPTLYGELNGFYGRKHTEETKEKIRKKRLGAKNPRNEVSKENSRKSALKYWSNETEQIEERRKKLGIEGKKYWEGTEEEINTKKENLKKLYEKRYLIVWPDGTEEVIVNLKQTCIERGFNHGSVYKVLRGVWRHYKGFKFYKLDD